MGQKLLPLAPVLLANNFDQGSLDGFFRMFQEGIMSYLAERNRLQAEATYRIDVQQCCWNSNNKERSWVELYIPANYSDYQNTKNN